MILDAWDSGSLGTRGRGDDRDTVGTPPGPVLSRLVATGLVVKTVEFGWLLKWRRVNGQWLRRSQDLNDLIGLLGGILGSIFLS